MALPSPYIPRVPYSVSNGAQFAYGVLGLGVNTCVYIPVMFEQAATVSTMTMPCTAAAGNFDLGFYDATLTKIATLGSTVATTGVKSLTLNTTVSAGVVYYAAFAQSGSTMQMMRSSGAQAGGAVFAETISVGVGHQATFPLPNTPAPAKPSVQAWYPVLAFVLV